MNPARVLPFASRPTNAEVLHGDRNETERPCPDGNLDRRSRTSCRISRQAHDDRPFAVASASSKARSRQRPTTTTKVRGTVNTASIDTNEPRRDDHLRSADFFDASIIPTSASSRPQIEHLGKGNYRVTGNLTMHGETRPVAEAAVHGVMRDPQGNDRVGLEVRGTISRSEFGLRWQQALETGGVVVGDEVRISPTSRRSAKPPGSDAAA